jgi:hypothetical protein
MSHVNHHNLELQAGRDASGNSVTAVRQSPLALMRQGKSPSELLEAQKPLIPSLLTLHL